MRVAVVGAGAVGGYFGGRLAEAGADLSVVARGASLQAIRRDGLRIDSPDGDLVVHPAVSDRPAELGEVDVVLLGVKTWQVKEAAAAMGPLIGPDTIVVPLQNGVEAPGQLVEVLGARHAGGGMCGIFAHLSGPGHVRHAGVDPFIRFGELDNRPSDRVRALLAAFADCRGVRAEVAPDIEAALWQKFLFIAPTSGMGAVAGAPFGALRSIGTVRALVHAAMEEIVAVGSARGVAWPAGSLQEAKDAFEGTPGGVTSSMQRDVEAGRPSELEAQAGAVVRLGAAAGVETPVNGFIYAALLPRERRARGELSF